ncbi:M23 family metallopeptidase [Pseudoalteromonas haloplanktis]|uniref:M23 family metallopeptidase n=1 Tax=Pseudoalteromonas haloplanktis TaxID=228 RepID=A0ABU1B9H8_PSEHA|nr:M23 family metallopeptidase [Pseudoalteromonas haloplanktis]MDQ9091170.1 M23 family metallopeptidase [Pseudoalteromonas haloplanktis]
MSAFIKSFYHKLFPARQLLIRQNGEVKHVILAPWLQVSAVVVVLIALAWLTISTLQIYSQTNKISDIEQSQLSKQQQWQLQKKQQQQQYEKQLAQLAVLEQKQALLQSMIDSLPESMSNPIDDAATIKNIETKELQDDFHEPLVDEKSPDSAQVSVQSVEQRITQLEAHYLQSFLQIEQQIELRHRDILTMLKGAGLDTALSRRLSGEVSETAQGGPLDLFDESKIPTEFLAIADKLLALNNLENLLSELPQTLPAANYYISSSFGLRKDPVNNRHAFHKGVDLAGWHKTEIFAPADGTVLRAGRNGGYGNFIELQHKNGFVTRFGHLNKIKVKKGQTVAKNDVIGLMGSTGRSTGTHLHYEVLLNDKHVNPVKITKALSRVR